MASDAWWGLPGPRRFVRRVADDIEDGRSVIIALPTPMADGGWGRRLADARVVRLSDRVPEAELRAAGKPAEVVARHLLPSDAFVEGDSVEQLCDAAACALTGVTASSSQGGMTIAVLECAPDWPAWSQWASFIELWAAASRNRPLAARIGFVAIVGGVSARELPGDQDSLRVRRWDAASDEADILTYAHLAFAEWRAPALHRRVAAAVAASLAIWDTDVVDLLASGTLADVLHPSPLLKQLGHDRGWTNAELARGAAWERGQRGSIGGAEKGHSAALVLAGDHSAIESRVWAGQVGVLLPFVEERRLEAIQALDGMLQIPWPTLFGDVCDVRELEIAHVADQVGRYRLPLDPALREALPVLRQVRNRLAHIEMVDAATLSDAKLLAVQHGAADREAVTFHRRPVAVPSGADPLPGIGPSMGSRRG